VIYEIFLAVFTDQYYSVQVLKKIQEKEDDVFQQRINAATASASGSYFFFEQTAIERAQ